MARRRVEQANTLTAYRCPVCDAWHVGNGVPSDIQREAVRVFVNALSAEMRARLMTEWSPDRSVRPRKRQKVCAAERA